MSSSSEDNFDLEAREESSQELSRRTPIHLGLLPGRFQEQRRDISSEELVGREETSELETREPKKKKAKILGRKRIQKGKAGPKKGKGKGKKGGRKAKILSYKRKGPWRGRRRDRRDL